MAMLEHMPTNGDTDSDTADNDCADDEGIGRGNGGLLNINAPVEEVTAAVACCKTCDDDSSMGADVSGSGAVEGRTSNIPGPVKKFDRPPALSMRCVVVGKSTPGTKGLAGVPNTPGPCIKPLLTD